jgi:nicotinate-nucleotide adenylyltransferase
VVALFGGSFDPIHFGHLNNADLIQQKFKFDKFLMLPCGDPPHKEKLLFNQQDRLKMLNLALQNYPNLRSDDFEFNNQISYTINTLKHFKNKYSNICFVMGSDSFLDLPNWDEFAKFSSLTNILVLNRDIKTNNLCGFEIENDIEKFKNSVGKVYFATNDLINISSTKIRSKIHYLEDLKNLVPQQVMKYINEYNTKTTNYSSLG